jgi:thiol:disulfide interchange protein DsbD
VFVALAASMFGFYELQLPAVVHSRVAAASQTLKGGESAGVALMGVLSAAIVSPCVAAPLAGALLYISQTRDVALGGAALFSLALGMGVPLIVVGVTGGALLPKSGHWMKAVKKFFGFMLLGLAIWIVAPVIPAALHMLAWAALSSSARYPTRSTPCPRRVGLRALLEGRRRDRAPCRRGARDRRALRQPRRAAAARGSARRRDAGCPAAARRASTRRARSPSSTRG